MVGKVIAYGGWVNVVNLRNMKPLDVNDKKDYAKELYDEDPKKYLEWKEWCIGLDELTDFFINNSNFSQLHPASSSYIPNVYESLKEGSSKIIIYLKRNEDSFSESKEISATHALEQIFDDEGNIVQENLKLKI